MPVIIICTDFSKASKNAISYSLNLVADKPGIENLEFVLTHFYDLPTSYAGEGIALTTIHSEIAHADNELENELDLIKREYPNLNIVSKMEMGSLGTGLFNLIDEIKPALVIIGAGGHYSELLSWDKELLAVLRNLTVPALIIPHHISFTSIKKIAFYCDIKNMNESMSFNLLKGIVKFINAELFILIAANQKFNQSVKYLKNEKFIHDNLNELNPIYINMKESDILTSVSHYIKDNDINLLMVTPRRFGIWKGLFQKDNSPALVRMDTIPILALREK